MTLAEAIASYGYAALALGTLLNSQTALILAGIAAGHGHLSLLPVIATATAGSFLGNQALFALGSSRGRELFADHPRWQAAFTRVFALIEKRRRLLILTFRFLYGLRTPTSIAIGISGAPRLEFTALNAAGATIWATFVGTLAFLLGEALVNTIDNFKHAEPYIFATVLVAALALWLFKLRPAKR